MDEDALEEDLVEELLDVVLGQLVGAGAVVDQVERFVEQVLGVLQIVAESGSLGGVVPERCVESILFGLHEGEWYRVGVVGLQKSFLFSFELAAFDVQLLSAAFGIAALDFELGADGVFQLGTKAGGQGRQESFVDLLDLVLNLADRHRLHLAVGGLVVAPAAHEVGVDGAGGGAGLLDEHARVTAAAVQGRFQEVLVPLGSFAEAPRGHDGLDHVEGFGVDERFVPSWILHALEGDDSLVVGVGQDLVEGRFFQRLAWNLWGRQGAHTASRELGRDVGQAELAQGVFAERPGDVLGPIRVEDDGTKFPALFIDGLDVLVAQRGAAGRATGAGLHRHALQDLNGEVAGVELVHRGEDAVQQHPGRSFIDRLGGGDQSHFAALQGAGDVSIVATVTCQAVELVDDDEVDLVLVEVFQHRVQVVAFDGAGAGLTAVLELLDDDCTHARGLVAVGFALGGDGESFDVTASATGLACR